MKEAIFTDKVYKPVGPYSTAIKKDNKLTLSGLIGLSVEGYIIEGGVVEETKLILQYLDAILKEADFTRNDILHVRIFLTDLEDFNAVNQVYAEFMKDTIPPSRECLQVSKLPRGAKVEITAIAEK